MSEEESREEKGGNAIENPKEEEEDQGGEERGNVPLSFPPLLFSPMPLSLFVFLRFLPRVDSLFF